MRGLAAIAGVLVLVAALVGCSGSGSDFSTAAPASEIAEAVAIQEEREEIFAESTQAFNAVKACIRAYRAVGDQKELVQCVRRNNVVLKRTAEELVALLEELEGFSPAAVEQSRNGSPP